MNRGNIFDSSSKEQQSSSVASRLASHWLPESSPESSVPLWRSCTWKYTNSHLFGRSPPESPSEGHSNRDLPLFTRAVVQPRFHSQTREMLSCSPGCGIRHESDIHCPASGTDRLDTGSRPRDARLPVDISGRTVKLIRPLESCSPDRTVGGPSALQRSAKSAGPATRSDGVEVEASDILASTIPEGLNMVGVPRAALSQQSGHLNTSIRPHHQDGCIPVGVGYCLQQQNNRGTLECGIGNSTHKLPGAQSLDSGLEVLPVRRNSVTTPGSGPASSISYFSGDGQHHCSRLLEQEGGTQSPTLSLLACCCRHAAHG